MYFLLHISALFPATADQIQETLIVEVHKCVHLFSSLQFYKDCQIDCQHLLAPTRYSISVTIVYKDSNKYIKKEAEQHRQKHKQKYIMLIR